MVFGTTLSRLVRLGLGLAAVEEVVVCVWDWVLVVALDCRFERVVVLLLTRLDVFIGLILVTVDEEDIVAEGDESK